MPDTKTITAQEHAEKIIKNAGGKKLKGGKWDMTKAVEREKAKQEAK